MIQAFSSVVRLDLIGQLDHLCQQIATGIQNSEMQIYATIAVILVASVLVFPPRNDPDQA
jgi:hypothetical protein